MSSGQSALQCHAPNVVEDESLSVVEPDADLPFLPLDQVPVHRETGDPTNRHVYTQIRNLVANIGRHTAGHNNCGVQLRAQGWKHKLLCPMFECYVWMHAPVAVEVQAPSNFQTCFAHLGPSGCSTLRGLMSVRHSFSIRSR
jgi:hypothetical protein